MRLYLKNFTESIPDFFRRCGYGFTGREGNEFIFARRLSGQDYPRFHIYSHLENGALIVNLHLDQKKPSYDNNRAHSGEYEGELIEQELQRIGNALKKLS